MFWLLVIAGRWAVKGGGGLFDKTECEGLRTCLVTGVFDKTAEACGGSATKEGLRGAMLMILGIIRTCGCC